MHPLLLSALLLIAGPLGSPFELQLEPAQLLVEHGGSLRLRLKSNCTDPKGSGNVETSLRKRLLPAPPGESLVELLNVTEWNSSLWAYYSCGGKRKVLPIKLLVYRPLDPPVLSPLRVLAVGQLLELSCSVPAAAPLRRLRLRLRLAGAVVLSASFTDREQDEPGLARVTHRLRLSRDHHGAAVTCEAELDLAPEGPTLRTVAEPQHIQVYDFPSDPELPRHVFLEPGQSLPVTCRVGDVFPAPRFRLALANQSLAVSLSADGRAARAELRPEGAGQQALVCDVSVGPRERRSEATVHVFWFPSPQLEVPITIGAGTEVGGNCSLPPGHFPQLRLRLRSGGRILTGWAPAPLLRFPVPAREEDDGMELSCEAELPGSGWEPRSSGTVLLNVTAPPRLDDVSCPPQQNWTEGQDESLRCWARGRPRPLLRCSRKGEPFPAQVRMRATRGHAGTYSCSATNRLGTATKTLTWCYWCWCRCWW
ncbi:intercellular adhesion molecule 1 isoform X2 [Melopsittacus undulatus]|uniref:intercellular adhesion molecule 1 isoform X2 n=1 Tax=Melopsittacus undulatus TaxID=13146 RepID=UPI00146EAC63|nr:intercellular adhesion molecule 5-like isoform X2 [Melopsittacus undulatus]